ncbi:hypothetical protein BH160DRAFT_3637 [Burkholderia sp. H160]|nr:hypothetical protein BH160DRAFT_3637 [Burkholderia sp. H160]
MFRPIDTAEGRPALRFSLRGDTYVFVYGLESNVLLTSSSGQIIAIRLGEWRKPS